MSEASPQQAAQKFGRRIGIAAFSTLLALFVVVCSTQILYQGFHSKTVAIASDCRQGIRQFITEIRLARAAAAIEVLGERAAMAKFRSVMILDHSARKSLEQPCNGDSWGRDALQAVDEWRWAEENAVRYESVDLAPSRRRIEAIESQLGPRTPNATQVIP